MGRKTRLYVLDVRGVAAGAVVEFEFQKDFHVSPFLDMDYRYRWTFTNPDDCLVVHMKNLNGEAVEFDATLSLSENR